MYLEGATIVSHNKVIITVSKIANGVGGGVLFQGYKKSFKMCLQADGDCHSNPINQVKIHFNITRRKQDSSEWFRSTKKG